MKITKKENVYHKVNWFGKTVETLEIGSFKYPSITVDGSFDHANAKRTNIKEQTVTYYSNALHAVSQFFDLPIEFLW
jgi:deoxyadenosine/deoxycytidine kinase